MIFRQAKQCDPHETGSFSPLPMKQAHTLYAVLVSASFMSPLFRISASLVLPMEAVRLGMMAGSPLTAKVRATSEDLPKLIRVSCLGNTLFWAFLVTVIALRFPIRVAGIASLLLGISCAIRDVFTMGGVNALSAPNEKGATFGVMNMLVVGTAATFQFGTGWIINRFPGAIPGTHDATGYLVCFGIILALLAASLSALRALSGGSLR